MHPLYYTTAELHASARYRDALAEAEQARRLSSLAPAPTGRPALAVLGEALQRFRVARLARTRPASATA
jgi:hypothetical protein